MTDAIVMAVAVALAGKAAEAVASGGRAAWLALVRLVRTRLAAHPDAAQVLDAAGTELNDDDDVSVLARHLQDLCRTDPAFRAELGRLWTEASAGVPADARSVVNQNHGAVYGTLVQSGEIHDGVHVGGPSSARA